MKKILKIICIFITTAFTLSSCSMVKLNLDYLNNDTSRRDINSQMDSILTAIGNKDKETLLQKFSENAITESVNLSNNIDILFEFFKGKFISYNDWAGPSVHDTWNYGNKFKEASSTYDITTDEGKYRVAMQYVIEDTANPSNIGIYSFYIINYDDDPNKVCAYWGDGEWTAGINFNKYYVED